MPAGGSNQTSGYYNPMYQPVNYSPYYGYYNYTSGYNYPSQSYYGYGYQAPSYWYGR